MSDVLPLKPIDVVVALRLAAVPEEKYEDLGGALGVSPSMAHASVRRLRDARLLRPGSRVVNRLTLLEFLEHGVRYAFPARLAGEVRGVPTAHAAPPLADQIVAEDAVVWPHVSGELKGRGVTPLYPQAVGLPARAPALYEAVALVDAIRVGRARERRLAARWLREKLGALAA